MAASGPRFCPRCGTGRVGDMRFCPNCGLDLEQMAPDDRPASEGSGSAVQAVPVTPAPPAVPADDLPAVPPTARDRGAVERPAWRPLVGPGLLVLLVAAVAWFVGVGPFARDAGDPGPLAGSDNPAPTSPFLPAVTAQPSFLPSPGLTAPPVGLTILSPADGAVVGAREVTVIGTAPPGLRITQDISFGFDRHATADGTGHWAIQVELTEGENQLKFRIGDDPSTTQTMRVTYVPPAS